MNIVVQFQTVHCIPNLINLFCSNNINGNQFVFLDTTKVLELPKRLLPADLVDGVVAVRPGPLSAARLARVQHGGDHLLRQCVRTQVRQLQDGRVARRRCRRRRGKDGVHRRQNVRLRFLQKDVPNE